MDKKEEVLCPCRYTDAMIYLIASEKPLNRCSRDEKTGGEE